MVMHISHILLRFVRREKDEQGCARNENIQQPKLPSQFTEL